MIYKITSNTIIGLINDALFLTSRFFSNVKNATVLSFPMFINQGFVDAFIKGFSKEKIFDEMLFYYNQEVLLFYPNRKLYRLRVNSYIKPVPIE
ncbi:hypothetical protein BJQ96_00262 [Flavobacterium sp. PL0002]|nr:hypothetical protein [Flavobacterium sp. PL002]